MLHSVRVSPCVTWAYEPITVYRISPICNSSLADGVTERDVMVGEIMAIQREAGTAKPADAAIDCRVASLDRRLKHLLLLFT